MTQWTLRLFAIPFVIGLITAILVFFIERRWKVGEKAEWYRAGFAFLMSALLSFNLQTLYESTCWSTEVVSTN
jgi:hypothetical protein